MYGVMYRGAENRLLEIVCLICVSHYYSSPISKEHAGLDVR